MPVAHSRPPPAKSAIMFIGKVGLSVVPGSICKYSQDRPCRTTSRAHGKNAAKSDIIDIMTYGCQRRHGYGAADGIYQP
jgi:hypothetical protein